MSLFQGRVGPPCTLADRLGRLNDQLASLAARMKEGVAGAVGETVAEAVRDAVRGLLGLDGQPHHDAPRYHGQTPHDRGWPDRDHASYAWAERRDAGRVWDDGDRWGEDGLDDPERNDLEVSKPVAAAVATGAATASRWEEAARAAVQAGTWWLRRPPASQPLLTTLLVAGVAGLTVLIAGPTLATAIGAGAALVSVAFAADSFRPALARLGALLAG